jgi:hypothetical protein
VCVCVCVCVCVVVGLHVERGGEESVEREREKTSEVLSRLFLPDEINTHLSLKHVASFLKFAQRCVKDGTPGGGLDLSCVTEECILRWVTLGLCHAQTFVTHKRTCGDKMNHHG